jgi:hypothetical protein
MEVIKMAEEKKEEKEKEYAYGPGEQSHLSRAFRGIFPETWLASEYNQQSGQEERSEPKQPKS